MGSRLEQLSWALGNAVIDAIEPRGDIPQTWNLDEVLTEEEMLRVADELAFKLAAYAPS